METYLLIANGLGIAWLIYLHILDRRQLTAAKILRDTIGHRSLWAVDVDKRREFEQAKREYDRVRG